MKEHCLKSHTQKNCSAFQGDAHTQKNGRWLGTVGKCSYSLRLDKYCPYYPHAPKDFELDKWIPTLNFKHAYHKLNQHTFTTIRGKTRFHDYEVGMYIHITLNDEHFCFTRLVSKKLAKIKDMDLAFLKQDAEYEGLEIYSHADFVNLLNSFNPPYYAQASIESEKTILYLEKC